MPTNLQTLFFSAREGHSLRGTQNTDVLFPVRSGYADNNTYDLSELLLTENRNGTLTLRNATSPHLSITLRGYDKNQDVLRTSDGTFTLQEILTHGNNAPFARQARMTAEAIRRGQ